MDGSLKSQTKTEAWRNDMKLNELTQNFKRNGFIRRKNGSAELWKIRELHWTKCGIEEVDGNGHATISYEDLDKIWMPTSKKRLKQTDIPQTGKDNFGNVLKVGDEVYYASSMYGSRGYTLRKGKVTGFTSQMVKVNGTCITAEKIGKIFPNASLPTEKIAAEFVN